MRFLPRFSLRFLWITLTIFLIVFAVVVNYFQRYQAHERIVQQLQALNGSVEEEPITFLGATIGKRLRGFELKLESKATLEVLEKLPRPDEVRRIGCNGLHYQNLKAHNRLCLTISCCQELEELHLSDFALTEEAIDHLKVLPKLRVLELTYVDLPSGSLQLLRKMPNLETLILDETSCDVKELLQLELPRLKQLYIVDTPLTYLELTKRDWGRFPLETLVIRGHNLHSINAEVSALPRLKHLDLGHTAAPCEIEWKNFTAAMPELSLLAVPTSWLEPAIIPELAKLARLRHLYVEVDQTPLTPPTPPNTESEPGAFETQLTLIVGGGQRLVLPPADFFSTAQKFAPLDLTANPQAVPRRLVPAIKELQAQRPDLLFSAEYASVIDLLDALGLQHYVTPMWPSPNWRLKPSASTQGGFF